MVVAGFKCRNGGREMRCLARRTASTSRAGAGASPAATCYAPPQSPSSPTHHGGNHEPHPAFPGPPATRADVNCEGGGEARSSTTTTSRLPREPPRCNATPPCSHTSSKSIPREWVAASHICAVHYCKV